MIPCFNARCCQFHFCEWFENVSNYQEVLPIIWVTKSLSITARPSAPLRLLADVLFCRLLCVAAEFVRGALQSPNGDIAAVSIFSLSKQRFNCAALCCPGCVLCFYGEKKMALAVLLDFTELDLVTVFDEEMVHCALCAVCGPLTFA